MSTMIRLWLRRLSKKCDKFLGYKGSRTEHSASIGQEERQGLRQRQCAWSLTIAGAVTMTTQGGPLPQARVPGGLVSRQSACVVG